MAIKRKSKTKRRRKSHSLSAAPTHRRRRSGVKKTKRRRRRGLSSPFSHASIAAAVKMVLGGTGGGFVAGVANQAMQNIPVLGRSAIQAGISYLFTGVIGWPNIGAGYAGGASALETQDVTRRMLSEMGLSANAKYADNKSANQLPVTLNANGVPMTLMEDTNTGKFMYFDEQSGNTYLAEEIYPQYVPRY